MNFKLQAHKFLNILFLVLICFLFISIVYAATPNPGHPWTDVGDGTFVVTGPTAARTYTFPDANATILTDNTDVTVAQGGTGLGSATQGDIWYASAANTMSALAKNTSATRYLSNTGTSNNPAWAQIDMTNGVTGALPVANGGTGLTTLTANNVILGNGTSNPTFVAPGSADNVLTSNGTTWTSVAEQTANSVVTRPTMATGAVTTSAAQGTSLTIGVAGLFTVPIKITINQLSFNATIGGTTPSYTLKSCVYDQTGATKLIDVTSTAKTASGVVTVTVSPAVTLYPGNYWIFLGLASQSGTTPTLTFSTFTSTAATWINTSAIPASKQKYEGTIVSRTSGTCDANLFSPGVLTNAVSSTGVVRLDN